VDVDHLFGSLLEVGQSLVESVVLNLATVWGKVGVQVLSWLVMKGFWDPLDCCTATWE